MSVADELTKEYETAHSHRAWIDLWDRTKIEITGPDRASFLHNFCTNDIKGLPIGGGCEAFLCNAKGKILAHLRVFALPESLWLDAAPGLGPNIVSHLDRYVITEEVQIADRTKELEQALIAGPTAGALFKSGSSLQAMETCVGKLGGVTAQIRRTDELTVPCYHVLFPSKNCFDIEVELLMGCQLASRECYEILRVEAGYPEYGQEIDESNYPQEVDRIPQTVSFTKGCYLGQEPIVMIRDRGQVHRLLRGLKLDSSAPAPVGSKILSAGAEVGKVTSSVFSPRIGSAIALGYLRRGSQEPGTVVEVETGEGSRVPAVVTKLPFV